MTRLCTALIAIMAGVALVLALTALWPSRANAQTYPDEVMIGGDKVRIEASEEGHLAQVVYENSTDESSGAGTRTIQIGEIVVDVQVRPDLGPETFIVRPQDPGMMAVPDWIEVEDGMGVVVQIMGALF